MKISRHTFPPSELNFNLSSDTIQSPTHFNHSSLASFFTNNLTAFLNHSGESLGTVLGMTGAIWAEVTGLLGGLVTPDGGGRFSFPFGLDDLFVLLTGRGFG
jgi:hypothetical protein